MEPKVRYRVKKKLPDANNQGLKHSKITINKRKRDLLKRINYDHTITVIVLPAVAGMYLFKYSDGFWPCNSKTLWFSVAYFNFTLLAFSCGYHKFFTHNSFITHVRLLQYYFAVFGSSVGVGSIKLWGSLHRAHHQFTDNTEKDPYLIKRGFYYAHFGWLVKRPKISAFYNEFIEHEFPKEAVTNEIFDVESDEVDMKKNDYNNNLKKLILWQNENYHLLFMITSILLPMIVTKFYCHDSFINGLVYPGILRMFLCQQCLLTTESVCHFGKIQVTIPTQPFNDTNSSVNCNNPLVSLLTYGQAKQNFHHEFPHDYRNDSSKLSFDPTKWFLYTLSLLGLIEDLSITPSDLITQLRIQQRQKVLNRLKSKLNWGTPISKLPLIPPMEFKRLIATSAHKNRIYIVIQNIIHDITPFMDQHPGGVPLLKASHGKDATKAFFGGVYSHLTAAQNLLATMRIGYLDVGNDEEVWKKIVNEEGEVQEKSHRQQAYNSAEAA